ncbi:site-2 protease family protein [Hahella sp. KA22]|uniref:site-2 protease family protein n=1 Tax=Hahella sp. KA22 TaxID=1628392 RepID=UPI000FDF2C84|nr:site-2 protease family protein [Hahella sp. KA22]AZZ95169.1 site-2 protease family protein [Hahella sp. KA22]QAY52814.1 site-2 protease family protein [Hahella sp. KA22]
MSYLFGFLLFVIFIRVLARSSAILQIMKRRVRLETSYVAVAKGEVEEAYQRILAPAFKELSELGFVDFCWFRGCEASRKDDLEAFFCFMYHPEQRTYAKLVSHTELTAVRETQCSFMTFFNNGETFETVNGYKHRILSDVANYHIEDPYVADLAEHWNLHLQRLGRTSAERLEKTPEAIGASGNAYFAGYREALLAQGVLKPVVTDAQRAQFTLKGALRLQKAAQAGSVRMAEVVNKASASTPTLDYQVLSHLRNDAMSASRESMGRLGKALLLLVSLGVLTLSFGFKLDIFPLLILVGVVFLHELGHLLAMMVCGYRDLQILFIPFVGGVRVDKGRISSWRKIIVYLMGPAPGLILGIGLCFHLPSDAPVWMTSAAFILIVLNYFNLAPIQPLDGGHLWSLLLFRRRPVIQLTFFCLSILAIAAFSWWAKEAVFGVIALLWVFLLPNQWRQARLFSHLRRHYPRLLESNRAEQLAAVYEGMKTLKLPWRKTVAYQQVNTLMRSFRDRPPRAWEFLFGMTLYLALVIGAPAALTQTRYGDALQDIVAPWLAKKGMNWDGQIANAKNPRERLSLLIAAGDYYFYSGDDAMAEKYYDLALKETERKGISPEEKIKVLYQLAQALFMNTNDKESVSIAYLQEALRLYQKERIQNGELIPDIYELLVECYLFQSDYMSALKNIDGAFANSDIRRNEQRVAQLYMLKGNALSELHRVVEAERAYIQGIKASKSVDFKRTVELRLLEFYLNEDLNDAAIKRLESLLYGPKAFTGYTDGISYNLNLRLAWAYYSKERYIDAEITLRSLLVDMTDAGLGDVSLLPALELLHIVQSAHDPWQAAGTRIWIEQIAENTLDLAPDAYIDSLREQLHFIPKSSRYRRKLAEAGLTSFGVKNASET